MKNILCIGLSVAMSLAIIPSSVIANTEDEIIYLFGNSANSYFEDFETYEGWSNIDSPNTIWENVTVGGDGTHRIIPDTIDGKGIYGNNAYQLENGRAFFKANEDKVIKSGKAYISFSERIRKEEVISSVSITDSQASLPTDTHASNYIFQIKNDGANFDLYVSGKKAADLTTNGGFNSNNMSYILDIDAIIDIDNDKLTIRATHNDSSNIITVDIPDTTDVGALHMATTSSNSGLQVDNISITNFENFEPITPPTATPDVSDEFEMLKDKWKAYIIGENIDLSVPQIQNYINNIDSSADSYWNSMIKSTVPDRKMIWSDLSMNTDNAAKVGEYGTTATYQESSEIVTTFTRLKTLAIAYATEGCKLYHNEELKNEILLAWDLMTSTVYYEDAPLFGNWYHWQISAPCAFLQGMIAMHEDISPERLDQYVAAVHKFVPKSTAKVVSKAPTPTGANLIEQAMNVAMTGVLDENTDKFDDFKSALKTTFVYSNQPGEAKDGFWQDGSYFQHSTIAYTGGYGAAFYEKLAPFFYVFADTDWELVYDDGSENVPLQFIFEGIEPLIYDGSFMEMAAGRHILNRSDRSIANGFISCLFAFTNSMSDEDNSRLKSMLKYYISLDPEYFYNSTGSIFSLQQSIELMSDDTVQPREEYIRHKRYASMDKVSHVTADFGFGVSMHSQRTSNYGIMNDEGKRLWNVSDGMTYIYNGDKDQYNSSYWCTVDPRRLSGTTSEFVMRSAGAGSWSKNPYSFVGGTDMDDLYGVTGMHLKTLGNGGSKDGTEAKKSWFMFDEEIVALGSGITSNTGNYVETIVDNRRINADASNTVTINGNVMDNITDNSVETTDNDGKTIPKGTDISDVSYIHLEGNNGTNIGYYFPENTDVRVLKEIRTGNWIDVTRYGGEATDAYATFAIEHGKKPSNDSYAYFILPTKTAEETAEYAETASENIEILQQTNDAHVVMNNKLNIKAANIWNATDEFNAGIRANAAASVMVRETDQTIEISISDPSQTRTSLTVELEGSAKSIISADNGVDIFSSDNVIQFVIDTSGSYGKTYKAVISKSLIDGKTEIDEIPKPDPNDDIIYIDENFDSLYNTNNTYIVKQPGNTLSPLILKNGDNTLSYCVDPRSNGSSDGTTGIKAYVDGTNKYIAAVSGGFASGNRHPYLLFDKMIPFAELDTSRTLSMSFSLSMNPSNDAAIVDFSDGSNSAFEFKTENNKLYISNGLDWQEIGEKNKWYDISMEFNADYTSFDLTVASNNSIIYNGTIAFKQNAKTINRVDFGYNVSNANYIAYIDNIKIVQKSNFISPFNIKEKINNDTHIGAIITPSDEYSENFILVAAHYQNNAYKGIQLFDILNGDTEIKFEKTDGTNKVKLFAWSGMDTMIPICPAIEIKE